MKRGKKLPGGDAVIVGTTRTLRARGKSEQSPAMVQLTRDFKKIRKQVSRRRTHVPDWMRVVSLGFFVVAILYLGSMYIYGTLQDGNDQTAARSFDDGIGGSSGNVGDGPGSPAAPPASAWS